MMTTVSDLRWLAEFIEDLPDGPHTDKSKRAHMKLQMELPRPLFTSLFENPL
jgi:hypothetical protein